jgi:GT2 family glycosyltransferase
LSPRSVQVIVATYEQPRYLDLVLRALEQQSAPDFGILVADDGSGPATRQVVAEARVRGRLRIQHLWQPNRGFRKCRSLNRAVAAARADYLVFLDGDALACNDWLERHLSQARPGRYLAGRMVRFDRDLSERIAIEDARSGRFERRGFLLREWWRGHLLQKPHYAFVPRFLPGWILGRDAGAWTGANASAWRDDVLRVNGFDERLTYGFEDTDFGLRLKLLGIRRRSVRYSAVTFHLDHDRPYRDEAAMERNRLLMEDAVRRQVARCFDGIDRLAAAPEPEAWIES